MTTPRREAAPEVRTALESVTTRRDCGHGYTDVVHVAPAHFDGPACPHCSDAGYANAIQRAEPCVICAALTVREAAAATPSPDPTPDEARDWYELDQRLLSSERALRILEEIAGLKRMPDEEWAVFAGRLKGIALHATLNAGATPPSSPPAPPDVPTLADAIHAAEPCQNPSLREDWPLFCPCMGRAQKFTAEYTRLTRSQEAASAEPSKEEVDG